MAVLGVMALIAFGLTLVYLAWRFEWRFGVAAVLGTLHDSLATLAFIKYLDIEISLFVVGGILTVIGYSMNDTVVVFDRIRENLRRNRKERLYDVINRSVNETLPRTVMTGTTTLASLLDFAPVDVRLSAYYGQAGVRLLGSSEHVVRPYVEASAGFARLRTGVSGFGATDPFVNAGLEFLDATRPMLGTGAGLLIQGGPVVVDLGYRYNKISAGNAIQSALTGGDLGVHQVRFGVGVRF